MKAQATFDFMLTFLAVMVFFTMLMAALSAANGVARAQTGVMAETAKMEEFVRVAEVYCNSGIAMTGKTDVTYKIENGVVRAEYGNKTIVVRGICDAPKAQGEPA